MPLKEYLRNTYKDAAVRPEVLSPDQRDGDLARISIFPNAAYQTVDYPEVHPPKPTQPKTTYKREEPQIEPSPKETVERNKEPSPKVAIHVQESQKVIPVPPLAKAGPANPLAETGSERISEPPLWDSPRLPGMEQNFDAELEEIETSRRLRLDRDPPRPAPEQSLIGLALSGGGVRSATFNLGVLQALAQRRLLHNFDYMSCVSGGGYIGSWLLGWMHHQRIGIREVEHRLAVGTDPSEVALVRDGSSLVPQDFLASYLRNTLLNLIILVMAVLSLLLLPPTIVYFLHVLEALEDLFKWKVSETLQFYLQSQYFALAVGLPLVIMAATFIGRNLEALGPNQGKDDCWFTTPSAIKVFIIFPLIGSAALFAYACTQILTQWGILDNPAFLAPLMGIAVYLGIWLVACLGGRLSSHKRRFVVIGPSWWLLLMTAAFTGAIIGYLFVPLAQILIHDIGRLDTPYSNWHVMTFGPPAVAAIVMFAGVIHIGLMGRGLSSVYRAWLGRLGGSLMLFALCWLALFWISIYFPYELGRLFRWDSLNHSLFVLIGVLIWIALTAYGVFFGKSEKNRMWNSYVTWQKKFLTMAAKTAPYVFILGLLLVLSILAAYFTNWANHLDRSPLELPSTLYFDIRVPSMCLFFIAAAIFISWRVDINESSVHQAGRDPLIRTYLGASLDRRDRAPSQTGNFAFAELMIPPGSVDPKDGRPYPILNASLVCRYRTSSVTRSLGIESFTLTPARCGFTRRLSSGDSWTSAHAPTELAGALLPGLKRGMTIGTFLGLSGGISNPKALIYTSPPFAFLMKVFDVRPGWWVGNPLRDNSWRQGSPPVGIVSLLQELFGANGVEGKYLTLSDGGLFENLGIYELVRRRCRLIVASDASYDPFYNFGDLQNAIERCRTDFGVEITIGTSELISSGSPQRAETQFAIGKIRYSRWSPEQDGVLIYLKPTLVAFDRANILGFFRSNPQFPQESTATHEFDRTRFESYRTLGEDVGFAASEAIAESVRALIS